MFLCPNDDSLTNGFCWGLYEVTVDTGPRIRLPRVIIRELEQSKVEKLWLYHDPTGPRLIICPDQSRQTYLKLAKQNLPKSLDEGKAYRNFICTGRSFLFQNHGKVSIASISNKELGENREFRAKAGEQVVIIGVGPWYEVWMQDDWLSNKRDNTN